MLPDIFCVALFDRAILADVKAVKASTAVRGFGVDAVPDVVNPGKHTIRLIKHVVDVADELFEAVRLKGIGIHGIAAVAVKNKDDVRGLVLDIVDGVHGVPLSGREPPL